MIKLLQKFAAGGIFFFFKFFDHMRNIVYNYPMNYFFSELSSGTSKFWLMIFIMGVWIVAILDAFTQAINGGKFFMTALVLTFVIPLVFAVGLYIYKTVQGKETKQVSQSNEAFEARRSVEMREIVRLQPDFNTHCYMCIHYNHDKLVCNRILSKDAHQQRVKDIILNKKKYCLYYHEPSVPVDIKPVVPDEPLSSKYRGIT